MGRFPMVRLGVTDWSRARELLNSADWPTTELLERARNAIDALKRTRLGGRCWEDDPGSSTASRAHVLVELPSRLNRSIATDIVAAAQSLAAGRPVVLVSDLAGGARQREIVALARANGWSLASPELNSWTLLDGAEAVLTYGGELGFLALVKRIEVHCFGRPYYAGWGLTEDHVAGIQLGRRSIQEVFAAVWLDATSYCDPFNGGPSSFEDSIALLGDWRRLNAENRKIAVCMGMSWWKRQHMKDLLRSTSGVPRFVRDPAAAVAWAQRHGGAVAVWASREPDALSELAAAARTPVVRIEDGFIRSRGLGADFFPAASVVLDREGVYADPSRPSSLETLLRETVFSSEICARARVLRTEIVRRRVSKYNTGRFDLSLDSESARRIFVPGQVEDDLSVARGGAGCTGNLDLLARVRAAAPDAFIVFKPHPDVDAGHRKGAVADSEILQFADKLVRDVSSIALIEAVDEVHTLTSLCGFEALLRGKAVTAYGQPFYAGWGLTHDLAPPARRGRALSLDALVAGVLILYPRYLDPKTGLPCSPELLLERLFDAELWKPGVLIGLRRIEGWLSRQGRRWGFGMSAGGA